MKRFYYLFAILLATSAIAADLPFSSYFANRPAASTPLGVSDKIMVLQGGTPKLASPANAGAQACIDVYDGATGPQGERGFRGYSGAQGLQGIQGPRGETGPAGPANALTIGTVTTVDYGTPAAAVITGDAPNQTLSLTLPQGPQGTNASVTQMAVLGAIHEPGGDPLERQPLSPQTDDTVMFQGRDLAGNVTWYATGGGKMAFQDINGLAYVTINPTTQAIEGRDTANRLRLSISRQGTITTYHTDGITPAFQVYSTGLTNASGGNPGGSNKAVQYNLNGSFAGFGRVSTATNGVKALIL